MDTSKSRAIVSTKLHRIAELAHKAPDMVLTSLAHHIDIEFLHEAYRRTRKRGAVGVDGVTADEYARNLGGNLATLHDRLKSGTYRAPPVRRVHIPKGDGGKTRPIGIPSFEDKILQRAVTMVLESVYEQDFLDCSYGFRPGRSQHGALEALWKGLMKMGGGWVIDMDLQGFFDALDHGCLRGFLDQRVRDGVLRRAIGKWLKAGVMESGGVSYPDTGSPQGGVISPLLANVYLHHVLDTWFERDVKPRLQGPAFLIRYADDAVIVCSNEYDARRVLGVLPKRLDRFALTLHPEKTQLVDFRRPGYRPGSRGDNPRSGTFDFLGFTHMWGQSRKKRWAVKRKTASGRFSRAIKKVALWCRVNRHLPIAEQHSALSSKLLGHYNYYGITGNSRSIACFYWRVIERWRFWLARRSNRSRATWVRYKAVLALYPLPPPKVMKSVFRRT